MKVKSKLQLAPDEKKLGKVEAKFSDGAFKVLGKKNGQLVEISENPMTYEDAKKFIKEQGIEKYYSNVDIVPYRGNKKKIKYIGKVKRKQTKSQNYSVNVKPKPKTSYHKDIKSHNVNIRVISGIKLRYKIFQGYDWKNANYIYHVIGINNDYAGEWHTTKREAQKELKLLSKKVIKGIYKSNG